MSKSDLKVIISGGGTGGHVFPAISIAQALRQMVPETEILFVGAKGRLEMTRVPEAGFQIVGLPVRGFDRKSVLRNIGVVLDLLGSMLRSWRIVRKFRPQVVVGVGGYASGPVCRVSQMRGIPVVIQEQNSYAGVTNRLLARRAARICVAYEGMQRYFPREKIVFTGNPVREEIQKMRITATEGRTNLGIPEGLKTILVLGGSLGAGSINAALLSDLKKFRNKPLFLIWQTGASEFDTIRKQVDEDAWPNIRVVPFIKKMEEVFAAADLIVSRAGAGTISELAIAGKPVILVPSPNVAEDHQTKNARALESRKAALMIPDKEVVNNLVPEILKLLNDDQKMQELAGNIKKMAMPDAAIRIVEEILKVIKSRKKK